MRLSARTDKQQRKEKVVWVLDGDRESGRAGGSRADGERREGGRERGRGREGEGEREREREFGFIPELCLAKRELPEPPKPTDSLSPRWSTLLACSRAASIVPVCSVWGGCVCVCVCALAWLGVCLCLRVWGKGTGTYMRV